MNSITIKKLEDQLLAAIFHNLSSTVATINLIINTDDISDEDIKRLKISINIFTRKFSFIRNIAYLNKSNNLDFNINSIISQISQLINFISQPTYIEKRIDRKLTEIIYRLAWIIGESIIAKSLKVFSCEIKIQGNKTSFIYSGEKINLQHYHQILVSDSNSTNNHISLMHLKALIEFYQYKIEIIEQKNNENILLEYIFQKSN